MYLDRFHILTRYNLLGLFQSFRSFVDTHYLLIQSYYLNDSELPRASFDALFDLGTQTDLALRAFETYRASLTSEIYHDYLERVDDLRVYLDTVPLIPKLFRLSKDSMANKYIVVNQSLESFAQQETGDRENWAQLAIRNNQFETDYDRNTNLALDRRRRRYNLASVIDTIDSDSVLGRDLPMALTFNGEDYGVLDNQATLLQTVNILAALLRNDNPNYPNIGLHKEMVSINLATVFSASIARQITDNFATDDSFTGVNINSMRHDNNSFFVEIEATTIAGRIQNDTISIAL